MSKSIISQSEFASLCNVSRNAILKAIKAGHIMTVKRSNIKKVHFDHEVTQAYLRKQQAKIKNRSNNSTIPQETSKSGKKDKNSASHGRNQVTLQSLQQEKVEEEIKKIRSDRKLKDLKLEEKRGDLIEKDTLGAIVFQYLDALNMNMLEYPDMIIDSLIDKVKSDQTRGELIQFMRKGLERSIVDTKTQITDRLK